MRTNGEIERDANIAKSLRRIADALEAISRKLDAPVYFTPREAIDAVTANPKIDGAQK